MSAGRRGAVGLIAGLATLVGIAGFVAATKAPFAFRRGWPLWHILHFNRVGATVTVVLGLVALAGALSGRRPLVLIAGGGFALCWGMTLVLTGGQSNWLGGRGNTLSFFLAATLGLLLAAIVPDAASPVRDGQSPAELDRSLADHAASNDSPAP